MANFVVISDSSCDLPLDVISKIDLKIVPFYVSFDQVKYHREHVDLSIEAFYKTMREKQVFPKSSLPTMGDYSDAFTPYLTAGKDILCFCLSSKFSGSYQSASNTANMLKEEFPDREIVVVDSLSATISQGAIALKATELRDEGFSIQEVITAIQPLITDAIIYFTVGSLEYLQRGGRVGKAAALAGTLLNIKPLLSLNNGELYPVVKVRGRKKALSEILERAVSFTKGRPQDFIFGILHADCYDDAMFLVNSLKNDYGIELELPLSWVGVTIGAHTGPDTLGIAVSPRV